MSTLGSCWPFVILWWHWDVWCPLPWVQDGFDPYPNMQAWLIFLAVRTASPSCVVPTLAGSSHCCVSIPFGQPKKNCCARPNPQAATRILHKTSGPQRARGLLCVSRVCLGSGADRGLLLDPKLSSNLMCVVGKSWFGVPQLWNFRSPRKHHGKNVLCHPGDINKDEK